MSHSPASAGQVRRALIADLEWQLPPAVLDEAVLLASELVGNSVRHARALPDGTIRVSWHIEDGLRLRVTDGGGLIEAPHLAHAGPMDTHGRGLSIVDAIAVVWGVERAEDGSTTVWAVLAGRERPDRTADAGEPIPAPTKPASADIAGHPGHPGRTESAPTRMMADAHYTE